MAVPSFARATRSSALKAGPRGEDPKDVTQSAEPERLRTKLKRPSTLTQRARKSIAYSSDLYHIKPLNALKLSPLAALPSELRTLIYAYVFGDLKRPILMNYGRMRHSPSALLQVCRAIRIEAAYIYFTEASFTWMVKNLNFALVMKWLQSQQQSHRALLSRNPNLTIEIIPGLLKSFTYPPKDFLLDDTMQNHWKACQAFGNLYTVKPTRPPDNRQPLMHFNDIDYDSTQDKAKVLFVIFCRLAAWARMRTLPSYANIHWEYLFDWPSDAHGKLSLYHSLWTQQSEIELFLARLNKLWSRNQCENRIRQPILEMFDKFMESFAMLEGPDGISFKEKPLFASLKAHGDRIKRWNRQSAT
ncbi:hypothetical protein OPT61_g635 [Boeremia exigua]|uniref:Uncharacterized protein n=1 Tax=Boeremia exigua TaxID=749465 RepID=A0ACC2ITE5_9PLEO|nr:hypothetical protein OPT61_g635 [Boeremia exigua]